MVIKGKEGFEDVVERGGVYISIKGMRGRVGMG